MGKWRHGCPEIDHLTRIGWSSAQCSLDGPGRAVPHQSTAPNRDSSVRACSVHARTLRNAHTVTRHALKWQRPSPTRQSRNRHVPAGNQLNSFRLPPWPQPLQNRNSTPRLSIPAVRARPSTTPDDNDDDKPSPRLSRVPASSHSFFVCHCHSTADIREDAAADSAIGHRIESLRLPPTAAVARRSSCDEPGQH